MKYREKYIKYKNKYLNLQKSGLYYNDTNVTRQAFIDELLANHDFEIMSTNSAYSITIFIPIPESLQDKIFQIEGQDRVTGLLFKICRIGKEIKDVFGDKIIYPNYTVSQFFDEINIQNDIYYRSIEEFGIPICPGIFGCSLKFGTASRDFFNIFKTGLKSNDNFIKKFSSFEDFLYLYKECGIIMMQMIDKYDSYYKLEKTLKEEKEYSEEDIDFHLNIPVLRILYQLHKLGYIHNDLHGNNILCKQNGEEINVFLIDFGNTYKISDLPTDITESFDLLMTREKKTWLVSELYVLIKNMDIGKNEKFKEKLFSPFDERELTIPTEYKKYNGEISVFIDDYERFIINDYEEFIKEKSKIEEERKHLEEKEKERQRLEEEERKKKRFEDAQKIKIRIEEIKEKKRLEDEEKKRLEDEEKKRLEVTRKPKKEIKDIFNDIIENEEQRNEEQRNEEQR
jgi:serine/threonine protein kinase